MSGMHVTDRDNLRLFLVQESAQVSTVSPIPKADAADSDAFARGGAAAAAKG
jgi:hypothetical protein